MIGGGRRRMRHHQAVPVVWSWLWSGGAGGTGGGGGGGAFVQRHLRLRRGASWGETPHPPPFRSAQVPAGGSSARRWLRRGGGERLRVHARPCCRAERMGREGCGGIEIRGRKHARDTAVLGWSRAG